MGFQLKRPLNREQVGFFRACLDDLIQRERREKDYQYEKLGEWPEFHRFVRAGYACGFVCEDISIQDAQPIYETVMRDPHAIAGMSQIGVRMFFHYLLRYERHVASGDDSGLVVGEFVRSPVPQFALVAMEGFVYDRDEE